MSTNGSGGHATAPRVAACVKWVDTRPEVDALTGAVHTDPRSRGASEAVRAAVEVALGMAERWGGTVEIVTAGPAGAEALRRLSRPCAVRIASTSQYLVRGMTEWLPGWVANGWRGSHGPVHNRDLWEALEKTAARHRIEWVWVRSGTHPWARRCEEALMEEIAAGKRLCAEECDVPNPLDWSPTPVVRQGSLFAPGPRLGGG